MTAQPVEYIRRAVRTMTTATTTATRLNSTVAPSAKENAAPMLRSWVRYSSAAEQADVLARLDGRDHDDLRDQVGQQDRGGQREEQAGARAPSGDGGGAVHRIRLLGQDVLLVRWACAAGDRPVER